MFVEVAFGVEIVTPAAGETDQVYEVAFATAPTAGTTGILNEIAAPEVIDAPQAGLEIGGAYGK